MDVMKICDMCLKQSRKLYDLGSSKVTKKQKEVCPACDKIILEEWTRVIEIATEEARAVVRRFIKSNAQLTLTPEELRKLVAERTYNG